MRSGGSTGKVKTGTTSSSGGRSGGKARRGADDLPTPRVLREYALVADGERGAVIGPDGSIAWLCVPALGQPGRLQRPARRPRPVHGHPGRPLARVGRLLRERQPDLAQPLGRRHQDRMQGSARDARRPAPGRAAAPGRGDRRHRPGHRHPRPAGRLRARHHDRPQAARRHLDRPQRRHLVPLVGSGQGAARRTAGWRCGSSSRRGRPTTSCSSCPIASSRPSRPTRGRAGAATEEAWSDVVARLR